MRNALRPLPLAFSSLLGVATLPSMATQPAAATTVLNLDFKADLQADGSLANMAPDAALAPPMQAMLRKQVAGWRWALGKASGACVREKSSNAPSTAGF